MRLRLKLQITIILLACCSCSSPEEIRVLSGTTGCISEIAVREGARVHTGDILIQLDTRSLLLRRKSLLTRIDLAELRRTDASALYRELEQLQLELTRLTITAPAAGRIAWLAPLRPGDTLRSGRIVALIR